MVVMSITTYVVTDETNSLLLEHDIIFQIMICVKNDIKNLKQKNRASYQKSEIVHNCNLSIFFMKNNTARFLKNYRKKNVVKCISRSHAKKEVARRARQSQGVNLNLFFYMSVNLG